MTIVWTIGQMMDALCSNGHLKSYEVRLTKGQRLPGAS